MAQLTLVLVYHGPLQRIHQTWEWRIAIDPFTTGNTIYVSASEKVLQLVQGRMPRTYFDIPERSPQRLWDSTPFQVVFESIFPKLVGWFTISTAPKTNMTGWKISMFNRTYIFIHGWLSIVNVSLGGYIYIYSPCFCPSLTSTKLSITKLPRGSGWEHTICALRKLWTAESTRCLCSQQPLSIKSLWNLYCSDQPTYPTFIFYLVGGSCANK